MDGTMHELPTAGGTAVAGNGAGSQDLHAKLDALTGQIAFLVERQRRQAELMDEMAPILRLMMGTATDKLADFEKRGYFAFGAEALQLVDRVVTGYKAEDVRALGDQIVRILDTVRSLTQPNVLAIANEATDVLRNADRLEPVGMLGMVKASRDDDVQRGMAVLLEMLRHVGRGATALAATEKTPHAERPSRMQAIRAARQPQAAAAPACKVASPGKAVTTVDGVAFTGDGFLADPQQWTRALAETLAKERGVTLTEAHWKLIDFARQEFLSTGVSPNIRRLTLATGLDTKSVYAMFPKAPGKTTALLAGIPKPAGCI